MSDFSEDLRRLGGMRDNEAGREEEARLRHALYGSLNAVLGFSTLLKDRRYGALTDKQLRFIDNIHAAGVKMQEILDTARRRSISRVEAAPVE